VSPANVGTVEECEEGPASGRQETLNTAIPALNYLRTFPVMYRNCEAYRVAVVLLGSRGGDAGLLKADERALSLVLVTPVFCTKIRYSSGR
jgi:hypothetical protein